MSPRQNRRRRDQHAAPSRRGIESVQEWPDGDWIVRHITGTTSGKLYRCPGCDQEIPGQMGHVVAWPADRSAGPEDRRHWHTPCWDARAKRGTNIQRSRGAPRYG